MINKKVTSLFISVFYSCFFPLSRYISTFLFVFLSLYFFISFIFSILFVYLLLFRVIFVFLCLISFFTLVSFLSLVISPPFFFLSFFILHLIYFFLFCFFICLCFALFTFLLCVCLFFPAFYCLFRLCLAPSVTTETRLHIAAPTLSTPSAIRFICIISAAERCSKSTVFIRRQCVSFIAWPQGCDIGCRSRDNMCGSDVRNCVINL